MATPRVYAWVAIVVSASRFPTTISRDTAFATHASALSVALRVGEGDEYMMKKIVALIVTLLLIVML